MPARGRFVLLPLLGLIACASQGTRAARAGRADDVLVFADGAHVAGYVGAHTIRIPAGARVVVDADLQLVATLDLILDGELVVPDRVDREADADAPDVSLRAGHAIVGRGSIIGGRGLSFDEALDLGADAGDGTTITLRAPKIWVTGVLRGGAGGHGGGGGSGGHGGNIYCIGGQPEADEFPEYRDGSSGGVICGAGGKGGRGCTAFRNGGHSGSGGGGGFFVDEAAARAAGH